MTQAPARLRPAAAEDLDWLIDRHGEVYGAEFGFDANFRDNIARKVADFTGRRDPFSRIWIAELGAQRVGSLAISQQPGGVAFLNFVLVLPAGRGRGVARALMEAALAHARAAGMSAVRLETLSCLADARRLYARFGFERVEVTPGMAAYGQRFDREFWSLAL